MPEMTGSALYIKFGTTVLSADFRTFDPDENIDFVDASAGADTNKTYLALLKDGTVSVGLVAQTGGSLLWTAIAPGTSGTLEWGEEGTATGKQKHTVLALVKGRKRTEPYDGLIVITADFQFNGAVTDGVY